MTDPWRPLAQCPALRPGEYLVAYEGATPHRRVAIWTGSWWRAGSGGPILRAPDHIYRPDDGAIWEVPHG